MNQLAPIILFVYNRPWHTQQTLEALAKNDLAKESILYIYADGTKENATETDLHKIEEVRKVISNFEGCKETHIITREKNFGLADNIIDGVTKIVNQYGKIIVLEDDIVTSIGFLKYMNDALDLYEKEDRVMHVSGYMFPVKKELPNSFFMNVTMCWGWATWKSTWKYYDKNPDYLINQMKKMKKWNTFDSLPFLHLKGQLEENQSKILYTWFIKWNASVFLKDGLTLFPSKSLVDNIGFDNTGENSGVQTKFKNDLVDDYILKKKIKIKVNNKIIKECNSYYELLNKENVSFFERVKKNLKKNIFFKKGSEILERKIHNKINAIHVENTQFSKTTVFEPRCIVKNSSLKEQTQVKKGAYLDHVILQDYVCIYDDTKVSKTNIGQGSYIGQNSKIHNTSIGKYCSIAPRVVIGLGTHPTSFISTSPIFYSLLEQTKLQLSDSAVFEEFNPIKIGNDVWIGTRCTIMDGITIGTGAIIAAGAVVTKDVAPYSIVGGVPAKVIKMRFSQDIIDYLLASEWWTLKIEQIKELLPVFQQPIKSLEQLRYYFENHEKK